MEEFLSRARSIQEIAKLLGCTELFIRKQIEYGNLKAYKFGNRFMRVMPEDLRAWLDEAASHVKVKPKQPLQELQNA